MIIVYHVGIESRRSGVHRSDVDQLSTDYLSAETPLIDLTGDGS